MTFRAMACNSIVNYATPRSPAPFSLVKILLHKELNWSIMSGFMTNPSCVHRQNRGMRTNYVCGLLNACGVRLAE